MTISYTYTKDIFIPPADEVGGGGGGGGGGGRGTLDSLYPHLTKLEWGVYWIHLVRPSLLWNFNFKFHMHVDDGHR